MLWIPSELVASAVIRRQVLRQESSADSSTGFPVDQMLGVHTMNTTKAMTAPANIPTRAPVAASGDEHEDTGGDGSADQRCHQRHGSGGSDAVGTAEITGKKTNRDRTTTVGTVEVKQRTFYLCLFSLFPAFIIVAILFAFIKEVAILAAPVFFHEPLDTRRGQLMRFSATTQPRVQEQDQTHAKSRKPVNPVAVLDAHQAPREEDIEFHF